MKISEFWSPRPHIIISDIFPEETVDSFLDEAVKLDKKFKVGTILVDNKEIVDIKNKFAHELHLDELYEDDRTKSSILSNFDKFLWGKEMGDLYINNRFPIFNTLKLTTRDNTHIIRYSHSNYYKWHRDANNIPYGFVTISYMFSSKEKKFTGGDFQIRYKDEVKTIPFKRNSMILFARNTEHRVIPIKLKSDNVRDYRYAIQHWAR
jgi:hypothetical protein